MMARWFRVRVALLLLLVWTATAGADAFDTARRALRLDVGRADATGYSLHGGVSYRSGMEPTTVTLFRGNASAGGGCSAANFVESLKEGFESIPGIITTVGESLVQAMPMLALCYGFPSLCDLAKHWQAIMNALLQFKYMRCEQAQTAAAYLGSRLAGGEQGKCLDYQVNTLKYPLGKAMDNCLSTVAFLTAPDGTQRTNMNLIEESLRYAGATNDTIQVARGLLGEVTLDVQGGRMGVNHRHAPAGLMGRYEYYRQDADAALDKALEELRSTGTVSDATVQQLSVPGQSLPVATLERLNALGQTPQKQKALQDKLSTATALTHLTWECGEVREQLAAAMDTNSSLTEGQRQQLELKLKRLEQDLRTVYERVKPVQEYYQPALTAIDEEYAKIQADAARLSLQAPAPVTLTLPFGRQTPNGNTR